MTLRNSIALFVLLACALAVTGGARADESPAVVDIPTELTDAQRVDNAITHVRDRSDPEAIAKLATVGDSVLPRLAPSITDPKADPNVALATVSLASKLPGPNAIDLLTTALQQPSQDVSAAALRALSAYDGNSLVSVGKERLKWVIMANIAASHIDAGAYLLMRWGSDSNVRSFLQSASDDLIEPGQATKGLGAVPPSSVVAYQAKEDRWSLAVYAAANEIGEPWARRRLRARLALRHPADLMAILGKVDYVNDPSVLADLAGCLTNETVCIETSVAGSVMVVSATDDKTQALETPSYSASVKSYRICDVAAMQLAKKAHIATGVPAIDAAHTADPETMRLSDADVDQARRVLLAHYALPKP